MGFRRRPGRLLMDPWAQFRVDSRGEEQVARTLMELGAALLLCLAGPAQAQNAIPSTSGLTPHRLTTSGSAVTFERPIWWGFSLAYSPNLQVFWFRRMSRLNVLPNPKPFCGCTLSPMT